MSKLVPKRRFDGFSGEWEEKKLGEQCFSISSGKTKALQDGEINVYGSTGIIGKTDMHTHNGNYILVARVGANAGFINCVTGKFSVTDNTLIIDLNKDKVIPQFLMPLLHRYNLNRLVFGSGQPLITGKQLKDLNLYFPKPKEQQKIANCLSSLDSLIEAQNKKVEALKAHKKGLMQQLFPSEGKTVPKPRFDGFSGEWEGKKLITVCEKIAQGGTPDTSKQEYWNGNIEWLTPAEMGNLDTRFIFSTNRKITKEGLKKCSSSLLPINSVILSTRAPIGHLLINKKEMAINQGCKALIPKKNIDYNYLYYNLYQKKRELNDLGAGNTFKELSKTTLENVNIFIPKDPKEQQKIADCLSSLDSLIEAQNKKVEALKEHKKGLMQQLFVSSEG